MSQIEKDNLAAFLFRGILRFSPVSRSGFRQFATQVEPSSLFFPAQPRDLYEGSSNSSLPLYALACFCSASAGDSHPTIFYLDSQHWRMRETLASANRSLANVIRGKIRKCRQADREYCKSRANEFWMKHLSLTFLAYVERDQLMLGKIQYFFETHIFNDKSWQVLSWAQ